MCASVSSTIALTADVREPKSNGRGLVVVREGVEVVRKDAEVVRAGMLVVSKEEEVVSEGLAVVR